MSKPTILLIPRDGDPHKLLAPGRAGAMVPLAAFDEVAGKSRPCPVCGAAVRWYRPPTDQMDPCYICSVDWQHQFEQEAVIVREWRVGHCRDRQARKALVLALDGEPVPEGVDRARRALAIAEGCPFDPANVVLVDDLYRREHFWRLVAFRWSGHDRRWGRSYAGKPVRLADFEHVPGIVAGDGSGMALVRALATIAAHRLGCEVVVVGEASDGQA
jgi:hypothetical protein